MSECSQPLTEGNLARHNRLVGSGRPDDMDSGGAAPERSGLKRTSSQRSSTADMDQETASVRSQASYTAAHYRINVLQPAGIFVRHGPLPKEVQPQIDKVIQRKISEERKLEICRIAKTLCHDFLNVLGRMSTKDDCIAPIHRALSSLDGGGKFGFIRKAGPVLPFLVSIWNVILTLS